MQRVPPFDNGVVFQFGDTDGRTRVFLVPKAALKILIMIIIIISTQKLPSTDPSAGTHGTQRLVDHEVVFVLLLLLLNKNSFRYGTNFDFM